jgi:hypothetical protein
VKYLIWSYDYDHASAGPKALHRLCHELNMAGQEAYVGPWTTNPDWITPVHDAPLSGDWTAVYPEIVRGNPWNAPHVARWVLNTPGLLGGDPTYDASEIVFAWHSEFLSGVPLLELPTIETDIYTDRHESRSGEAFYIGKGYGEWPGAEVITLAMRRDRHALADLLNRVTLLHTFDDTTAMILIAALCGCSVHVVSSGVTIDPAGARDDYFRRAARSGEQLAGFIQATDLVPA